jgi:hypothetical protein
MIRGARVQRLTKFGPTTATLRTVVRFHQMPSRRRAAPPIRAILPTPAAVVYAESVSELLVFTHRARTNQAPLATGRYRR